jgi:hypothetical protein
LAELTDAYRLLGLEPSQSLTKAEVHKAWRQRTDEKGNHPDRETTQRGREAANERFIQLQLAEDAVNEDIAGRRQERSKAAAAAASADARAAGKRRQRADSATRNPWESFESTRQRRNAPPPDLYLYPQVIHLAVEQGSDSSIAVRVSVRNRGGPHAGGCRITKPSKPLWELVPAPVGNRRAPDEVAVFYLRPSESASSLPVGEHQDAVEIVGSGTALMLSVVLVVEERSLKTRLSGLAKVLAFAVLLAGFFGGPWAIVAAAGLGKDHLDTAQTLLQLACGIWFLANLAAVGAFVSYVFSPP